MAEHKVSPPPAYSQPTEDTMFNDGIHSIFPGSRDEDFKHKDMTPEQAAAYDARSTRLTELFNEFLAARGYKSPYQMTQEDERQWNVIANQWSKGEI